MPTTKKKPAKKSAKKPAKKPARSPAERSVRLTSARAIPDADRLLAALRRMHDGDPWHGPSRAVILADVTPREAAWHPGAGAHSIWEIVLHMRSWTREVERRALGGVPAEPIDGDWPPVTDTGDGAWRAVLASLDAAHGHLLAVIRSLPTARLAERVGSSGDAPLGTGITVRAMLWSLADHDVYHSGQVSLLKRLARGALAD